MHRRYSGVNLQGSPIAGDDASRSAAFQNASGSSLGGASMGDFPGDSFDLVNNFHSVPGFVRVDQFACEISFMDIH